MLCNVRINNSFIFNNEISMSMEADMRNNRLSSNVCNINNFNVLKCIGIFGQNNVGKTNFIKALQAIQNVILHKDFDITNNFFTNSHICEFGVSFINNNQKYNYEFSYDIQKKEYPYEKFEEISKDNYGNIKKDLWVEKNYNSKEFVCRNKSLENSLQLLSKNSILIYLLDSESFQIIKDMKSILLAFANNMDFVFLPNIPIEKTIELLKSDSKMQKRISDFVKNADLYMDNFKYADESELTIGNDINQNKINEDALKMKEMMIDQFRLVSTYKGVPVPSIVFDSTGTKIMEALASYIIDSIDKGKILVIDELDNSLHFRLTRAIVALFNNELNVNGQLIFTTHDISLLDINKLFRKEQIYFIDKNDQEVYIFPLSKYRAKDGIRDTSDIVEKYKKGIIGAIPEPNLIKSLLDIKGGNR